MGKYSPCSWTAKVNIVNMPIPHKAMCKFNAMHIKIPMAFFWELRKKKTKIHTFIQKHKRLEEQK